MSNIANAQIRETANSLGIRLWQVAERYGITDGNFSRKLRRELPQQEQEKILEIIKNLAAEKAGEG